MEPPPAAMNPFAFMHIGGDNRISKGSQSQDSHPKGHAGTNFMKNHQETLPDADFIDEKTVTLPGQMTAQQAHDHLFAHAPQWMDGLMRLRNAIVRRLGLVEVEVGQFPVVFCSHQKIILGLDDRHLNFRISIQVLRHSDTSTETAVTTLVKINSLLGRIYLTMVLPFHHAIVRSMLTRAQQ